MSTLTCRGLAAGLAALCLYQSASAQIRRDPNGVNVNAQGATSVFITYGNLQGMVPVEAEWCGELMPAAPATGLRCDPATVFGRLPLRYDRSRASGQGGFTDVMTIPPSVARRAYQAAEAGAVSSFFYVRRFVDPQGGRADEYVFVTCRMTGGGARTPFSLVNVRLAFETDDPVLSLAAGERPPRARARITFNGTGRLRGRWEIVLPSDEPPSTEDLLTEAALPAELRGTQRRFTELERFSVFLPPTGEVVLDAPDPDKLPNRLPGLHQLLLRIEAADDKEGDSNLEVAGAGAGVVHSGGVAGFPIPPLRYYVGSAAGIGPAAGGFNALHPLDGAELTMPGPLVFSWSLMPGAALYRLEIDNQDGVRILEALIKPDAGSYQAPPWLAERLGMPGLRWRVVAIGSDGRRLASTIPRSARITQ